jgi:hypothetical protein
MLAVDLVDRLVGFWGGPEPDEGVVPESEVRGRLTQPEEAAALWVLVTSVS